MDAVAVMRFLKQICANHPARSSGQNALFAGRAAGYTDTLTADRFSTVA